MPTVMRRSRVVFLLGAGLALSLVGNSRVGARAGRYYPTPRLAHPRHALNRRLEVGLGEPRP